MIERFPQIFKFAALCVLLQPDSQISFLDLMRLFLHDLQRMDQVLSRQIQKQEDHWDQKQKRIQNKILIRVDRPEKLPHISGQDRLKLKIAPLDLLMDIGRAVSFFKLRLRRYLQLFCFFPDGIFSLTNDRLTIQREPGTDPVKKGQKRFKTVLFVQTMDKHAPRLVAVVHQITDNVQTAVLFKHTDGSVQCLCQSQDLFAVLFPENLQLTITAVCLRIVIRHMELFRILQQHKHGAADLLSFAIGSRQIVLSVIVCSRIAYALLPPGGIILV